MAESERLDWEGMRNRLERLKALADRRGALPDVQNVPAMMSKLLLRRRRLPGITRFIAPDDHHVAFHEAGHAAIALALGIPVVSATIVPAGRSLGRVITGEVGSVRDWAIANCAGPIAGELLGSRSVGASWDALRDALRFPNHVSEITDLLPEIRSMLAYEGIDSSAEEMLMDCFHRAGDLVEQYRETITAVASALLEHHSLNRDELQRLWAANLA